MCTCHVCADSELRRWGRRELVYRLRPMWDRSACELETLASDVELQVSRKAVSESDYRTRIAHKVTAAETTVIQQLRPSGETTPRHAGSAVPSTWSLSITGDAPTLTLHPLARESEEFAQVAGSFHDGGLVCPSRYAILRIQRIQNKRLWAEYAFERDRVARQNASDPNEATCMWHGSSGIHPRRIYGDTDGPGFDMRYSGQGMWGRGAYFSDKSNYSLAYAHHTRATASDSTMVLLRARVIRGRIDERGVASQPNLRRPAEGCHSVRAHTKGANVVVLYETTVRAYPEYEVEYRRVPATETPLDLNSGIYADISNGSLTMYGPNVRPPKRMRSR